MDSFPILAWTLPISSRPVKLGLGRRLGKTNTNEATILVRKSLAGSRTASRKRRWKPIYIAPILILIVALLSYVVLVPPPSRASAVLNYTVNISIAYSDNSTGTPRIRYIPPRIAIGVPGGIWLNHTFDSYGVGSNYPVFSLQPPSTNYPGYIQIYVRSTVDRVYTLGDFFAIWGEPIGMKNTLGLTTPPSSAVMSTFSVGSTWFWDMCVGPNPNSLHEGSWGAETLAPGKNIVLLYSYLGCVSSP